MNYQGSCHCGHIAFEAEGELAKVVACNCSICSKKGALHWFVGPEQFRLLTPESNLATYTFNQHAIKHHFCPRCGVAPFSEGKAPSGKYMFAINARCLDGVELGTIPVGHFDGKAL